MTAQHSLAVQMNIFEAEAALFLETTRKIAKEVCRIWGDVTADEVRIHFQQLHPEVTWNNAAGAIFRHPDFEWTGQVRKSSIGRRRRGLVRVWRLRNR